MRIKELTRLSKKINLSDMEDIIAEVLDNNSNVVITAAGVSMEPFIHDGKDNVSLKKPQKRPQKGDVVFYKRSSGKLVLHRIVGEDENGYVLCGDNQWAEEYGIKESQIIAVLDSVERNGKTYDSDSLYFKFYKTFLTPIKWGRRIKTSVSIRLRGDNKND